MMILMLLMILMVFVADAVTVRSVWTLWWRLQFSVCQLWVAPKKYERSFGCTVGK